MPAAGLPAGRAVAGGAAVSCFAAERVDAPRGTAALQRKRTTAWPSKSVWLSNEMPRVEYVGSEIILQNKNKNKNCKFTIVRRQGYNVLVEFRSQFVVDLW